MKACGQVKNLLHRERGDCEYRDLQVGDEVNPRPVFIFS